MPDIYEAFMSKPSQGKPGDAPRLPVVKVSGPGTPVVPAAPAPVEQAPIQESPAAAPGSVYTPPPSLVGMETDDNGVWSVSEAILADEDLRVRQAIAGMDTGDIPIDEMYARWDTARAYSRMYGVPATEIFQNIDAYDKDFYGKKPDYKTAPKAILDAALAQVTSMKMGKKYTSLLAMRGAGGLFGVSASPEDEAALIQEIDALKEQMGLYSTDVIPRSGVTKFFKLVAGAVPYTADVTVKAAATGAALSLAGGTLGLSSSAAFASAKALATSLVGYTAGARIMIGMEYGSMLDRGIDEKVAARAAMFSGLAQAAVEQFLGMEGGIAGAMSKGAVGRVSEKLMVKMLASGATTQFAEVLAKRLLISTGSEILEEGSQEFISGLSTLIAQSISEDEDLGSVVNPLTLRQASENIATSMFQAAVTSPFIGLPQELLFSAQNVSELKALAAVAPTMGAEAFAAKAKAALEAAGVAEGETRKYADSMRDAALDRQAREGEARAQAAFDRARSGETDEGIDIQRGERGELRTEEQSQGDGESIFVTGSVYGKSETYGSVAAKVDEAAKTIRITDAAVDDKHLPLLGEMIQNVSNKYPGFAVELESSDQALRGAFEKFKAGEALPAPTAMDEDEAMEFSRVSKELDNLSDDTGELTAVGRSLVSAFGDISGDRLGFLKSLSIKRSSRQELGTMASSEAGINGGIATGATSLESIAGVARSLIYIADDVDTPDKAKSLAHEIEHSFMHYALNGGSDDIRSVLTGLYGEPESELDGQKSWSPYQQEKFVSDFEEWQIGKVKSPESANIFARVGQLLREIYHSITGRSRISPEAKAAFDEVFGKYADKLEAGIDKTIIAAGKYERIPKAEHPVIKARLDKERVEAVIREEAAARGISEAEIAEARSKYGKKATAYVKSLSAKSSRASVKDRAFLYKSGLWVVDKQLVAEVKLFSGETLTSEESDLLKLACNLTPDYDGDVQNLLFGDKLVEKIDDAPPDLLFSVGDNARKVKESLAEDMARGSGTSFEGWAKEQGYKAAELSDDDRAFLEDVYALAKGGKERKYKPGEFAASMKGEAANEFVASIEKMLYGSKRGTDGPYAARVRRVEAAIGRTPEIARAVKRYHDAKVSGKPNLSSIGQGLKLQSDIRSYEGAYKYLYSLVEGDDALATEAIADLKEMPILVARDIVTAQDTSISEIKSVLDDVRTKELRDKIKSREFTMSDVDKYLALAEKEVAGRSLEKDMKAEAREGDKVAARWKKEAVALQRLKAKMQRVKRYILRKPSRSVNYEQSAAIRLIQEYIKTGADIDIESLENYTAHAFMQTPGLAEAYIRQIKAITDRSFDDWSADEIEAVAEIIRELSKAGRDELRNKKAALRAMSRADREAILKALKSRKDSGAFAPAGSTEEDQRRRKLSFKRLLSSASRPDAFIRKHLGSDAARALFDDVVTQERMKLYEYDRRTKGVTDYLASSGLAKNRRLYEKVSASSLMTDNLPYTITLNELVGIRLYVGTRTEYNQDQRDAFIYGNLYTDEEKGLSSELTKAEQKTVNAGMKSKYEQKLEAAIALVESEFAKHPELEALSQKMLASLDAEGDWDRFAEAVIDLTNDEPKKSKFYFPIYRMGQFTEGEDTVSDALQKNFGLQQSLDMNMAISRVAIQPRNQNKISIDALKTYYSAVERQEHLVNMGPQIKHLRAVFSGKGAASGVQERVVQQLGQEAMDFINDQIDAITNPNNYEAAQGSKLFNAFRGSMIISNLSWRASSVLMQLMTSPLPFLSEVNPVSLMASSVAAYTYKGGVGKFISDMEELSPTLKHRQMAPELALIEQRIERGMASKLEVLGSIGMKGLTFADRVSVAVGWKAIFDKQVAKMKPGIAVALKESFPEIQATDLEIETDREAKLKAAEYADRAVLKLQPTSESMYRAPMYRNMNAFKQLVLQFTQPLNVIFNNLYYDVPDAVKSKELNKAVGLIAAYALSGLAMGAVQVLRGRGPDEPDEEKWARYWIHATTTQFTDSIPFIGQWVTGLTGKAMTGEDKSWLRNDTAMPAADLLFRAAEGFMAEEADYGKIALNAATGLGMMAGAPVRAVVEYGRMLEAALGKE